MIGFILVLAFGFIVYAAGNHFGYTTGIKDAAEAVAQKAETLEAEAKIEYTKLVSLIKGLLL